MHNQHSNEHKKILWAAQPVSSWSSRYFYLMWELLKVCLCILHGCESWHLLSHIRSPMPSSRSPFSPWCHRATLLLLLMPTTSFYSETHQSACCLIGSERWERIAIRSPAPKSSLWTCHSRRITCGRLVLHLTKGSPISTGRDNYTHNIPMLFHRASPNQQHKDRRLFAMFCIHDI